jgi:hypothetical protein
MNSLKISVVLAMSLLIAGSCADINDIPAALRIAGQVVPDDSCVVKTSGGAQQEFKSRGELDLAVGSTYMGYLMVENAFPQFASLTGAQPEQGLVDPSTIHVDYLDITLRMNEALLVGSAGFVTKYGELFGIAPVLPLAYKVPGVTSIPATTGGAVLAPLIPHNIGLLFRELSQIQDGDSIEVVLDVKVVGHRQDGLNVQSGVFSFPITFCNRCLVQDRFDVGVALDPFGAENNLTDQDIGVFCEPGQDAFVTNAICGVLYPKQIPGFCPVDRCLGLAGATLSCAEDPQVFEVPQ